MLDSALSAIGQTPLVALDRLAEGLPGRVALKLTLLNPHATAAVIDREAAILAVEKIARESAEPCGIPQSPAQTRVVVMFAPSGRAKGAAIVGGLGYTRPGRCLANALLLASVPEFLGPSTSVPVTVRLR